MEKRIEILNETCGIFCDNIKCGWKDDTVKVNEIEKWLNISCPDCGENLLTQEDYDLHEQAMIMVNFINDVSEEELETLAATIKVGDTSSCLSEEQLSFINEIEEDEEVGFELKIHKKISIENLRKIS